MTTRPVGQDQIRFGDFTLDVGARELRLGERSVHLTPKAFEMLAILIEQRPRVVAKSVLQERLWPATFVSEANLPILVAEIRSALFGWDGRRRYADFLRRSELPPNRSAPGPRGSCPRDPMKNL